MLLVSVHITVAILAFNVFVLNTNEGLSGFSLVSFMSVINVNCGLLHRNIV